MTKAKDTSGSGLRQSKTTERHIKVNQIHYDYRTKQQPPNSGCRSVPWIQMKGHWLRQAGFEIDTPIKVRVMDGCLILTTEPNQ